MERRYRIVARVARLVGAPGAHSVWTIYDNHGFAVSVHSNRTDAEIARRALQEEVSE